MLGVIFVGKVEQMSLVDAMTFRDRCGRSQLKQKQSDVKEGTRKCSLSVLIHLTLRVKLLCEKCQSEEIFILPLGTLSQSFQKEHTFVQPSVLQVSNRFGLAGGGAEKTPANDSNNIKLIIYGLG